MNNEVNDWLEGFFDLNPDAKQEIEVTKKKESTLALATELSAMDFRKKDFYKELSPEHKKEISLWVLMRFMSSSQSMPAHHLMMVNDLVNNNFSSLSKHPELQWRLLALCGTGKTQYHPWIPPMRGIKKNHIEQAIVDRYPLLSNSEIALLLKINTQDELKEFFKENGYDDKTIKEIFKDTKGK